MKKILLPDELIIDAIYTLYYQSKEEGYFFPGEIHEFWELVYIIKGYICLILDGKEFILGPGDLMFYAENQNHVFWADRKTAPDFLTISFDISFIHSDFYKDRVFKADSKIKSIFKDILKLRNEAFEGGIISYSMKQKPEGKLPKQYIRVLLTELMLYLFVFLNNEKSVDYSKVDTISIDINPLVKKGIGYIQKNIDKKIYISEICRYVAVSQTYFNKLFRKNTGMSVVEYINTEKLKKSKQLLRVTERSITSISEDVGFSTVYYFSNLFKKKYGISPTQYRNSIL